MAPHCSVALLRLTAVVVVTILVLILAVVCLVGERDKVPPLTVMPPVKL